MTEKFKFRPFYLQTHSRDDNLNRLNIIHSLSRAYQSSGYSEVDAAAEFYSAAGDVFAGKTVKQLDLKLIRILGER
ncbi:MAG: hypothetical protein ACFFB3_24460 [Candidatus Hodarchaeota archaeon]